MDAFKNGGKPYEITVPKVLKTDKDGDKKAGVKSKAPNYKFDWEMVCEYKKWTPSNQFINAGKTYDEKTMILSRFGMIGSAKTCFWGMTGVHWLKPLKVDQILSHHTTVKAPPKKVVKKPTVSLTTKLGKRRINVEDEHSKSIGFTSKKVGGHNVLQMELNGAGQDMWELEQVKSGKYKSMYAMRNLHTK